MTRKNDFKAPQLKCFS